MAAIAAAQIMTWTGPEKKRCRPTRSGVVYAFVSALRKRSANARLSRRDAGLALGPARHAMPDVPGDALRLTKLHAIANARTARISVRMTNHEPSPTKE